VRVDELSAAQFRMCRLQVSDVLALEILKICYQLFGFGGRHVTLMTSNKNLDLEWTPNCDLLKIPMVADICEGCLAVLLPIV
jgi:hypothetical protein